MQDGDDYQVLEELGSTALTTIIPCSPADTHVLQAAASALFTRPLRGQLAKSLPSNMYDHTPQPTSHEHKLTSAFQIDLEGSDDDIREIQQEIALLSTCASPYVTQYKTSFVRGVKLWIVMEFLGGGSCLDLVRSSHEVNHEYP